MIKPMQMVMRWRYMWSDPSMVVCGHGIADLRRCGLWVGGVEARLRGGWTSSMKGSRDEGWWLAALGGLLVGEAFFQCIPLLAEVGDKVVAVVHAVINSSRCPEIESTPKGVGVGRGDGVGESEGDGRNLGCRQLDGCSGVQADVQANSLTLQGGQGNILTIVG